MFIAYSGGLCCRSVGLKSLYLWDFGFEFRRGMDIVYCECCVLCRQRPVRRGLSHVQKIATECVCLIVCDLETSK